MSYSYRNNKYVMTINNLQLRNARSKQTIFNYAMQDQNKQSSTTQCKIKTSNLQLRNARSKQAIFNYAMQDQNFLI